jgi:hypothetical protein
MVSMDRVKLIIACADCDMDYIHSVSKHFDFENIMETICRHGTTYMLKTYVDTLSASVVYRYLSKNCQSPHRIEFLKVLVDKLAQQCDQHQKVLHLLLTTDLFEYALTKCDSGVTPELLEDACDIKDLKKVKLIAEMLTFDQVQTVFKLKVRHAWNVDALTYMITKSNLTEIDDILENADIDMIRYLKNKFQLLEKHVGLILHFALQRADVNMVNYLMENFNLENKHLGYFPENNKNDPRTTNIKIILDILIEALE